jgi:hypothetical protein
MMNEVATGDMVRSRPEAAHRVTIAFTWSGLSALGVDEASLATFPEEGVITDAGPLPSVREANTPNLTSGILYNISDAR